MRIAAWTFVTILIVAHLPASAESLYGLEKNRGHGTVDIEFVRSVQIHPRSDSMTKICRAGYEVKGCTDFPIETLECHCERKGNAWVISASATLQAIIHLPNSHTNTNLRAHEELHLSDLREGLQQHLDTIASREYDSAFTCRRFASFLTTSSHLRVVMNKLRVASNERLGCSRKH